MTVTYEDIKAAAKHLEDKVIRTPALSSTALSELCGADIALKLENLQV